MIKRYDILGEIDSWKEYNNSGEHVSYKDFQKLRELCNEFVNLTEMIIEDYANVPPEVEDHAFRVNQKFEKWRMKNEIN